MKYFLLFIVALALVLRLPQLTGSFWLDEAAQALEVTRPWHQQLNIVDDFQPPFMHVLLHIAQYASHSEWWLRLWGALIPGLLTVALTYQLGKKAAAPVIGAAAAILVATSSLHVFYSQELRPYMLPALFASFTWYLLLTNTKLKPKSQLAFVLATAAGLYSSYLYPFVIIGQALFQLATSAQERKQFLLLTSFGVLLFAPWIPGFLDQLHAGQQLRSDLPGWEVVVSTPQLKVLPLTLGKFIYGIVPIDLNVWYILPIILIGALVLTNLHKPLAAISKSEQRFLFGLVCWSLGSILVAWLVSFWIPVVQPKRVLYALPALYLFVTHLLLFHLEPVIKKQRAPIRFTVKQRLSIYAVAGLLVINLAGLTRYYADPQLQRENWRSLISEMHQRYPAEKSIAVFSFPEPFAPSRWYTDSYPTVSTGKLTTAAVPDLADQLKPVIEYEYVLVFDYLRDLTDPDNHVPITLESFGFKQVELIDYPNIGFVRVFSKSPTVTAYAHRH